MNKFIFTSSFSFLIVLTLCSYVSLFDYGTRQNQIMNAYNKKMKCEKKLAPYGSGGAMTDDLQSIMVAYRINLSVDVQTARKMYIEIAEGLIATVNADPLIRPFLHNYPSTIKNIELKLKFCDNSLKSPPKGFVSYVYVIKNNIYYATYDHDKDDVLNLYQEPYEEALRIVREQCNPTLHDPNQ